MTFALYDVRNRTPDIHMPPAARTRRVRSAAILVLLGMRDGEDYVHPEAPAAALRMLLVRPGDRGLLGAVSGSVGGHIEHLSGGEVALSSSFVPYRLSMVPAFPVEAAVVAGMVVGGKSSAATVVWLSVRPETG